MRLDLYSSCTIMSYIDHGVVVTRYVDPQELGLALIPDVHINTGLLPENTLWYTESVKGKQIGLWRPPQTWKVSLQEDPFKPVRRFILPMPGLVFVCTPGYQPRIYAAKKRPNSLTETIYHAPTYNTYADGTTCAGSHHYGLDMSRIPEEFFVVPFSLTGGSGCSKKYPTSMLLLWEELDGKSVYPMDDLVKYGTLKTVIDKGKVNIEVNDE